MSRGTVDEFLAKSRRYGATKVRVVPTGFDGTYLTVVVRFYIRRFNQWEFHQESVAKLGVQPGGAFGQRDWFEIGNLYLPVHENGGEPMKGDVESDDWADWMEE